jgi:hypothetical protein
MHGEKAGNRHSTHHMALTNSHSEDTQGRQRWLGEGLTGHLLSPMSHQHPRHRPASHPMQRARRRNKQERGREREGEREEKRAREREGRGGGQQTRERKRRRESSALSKKTEKVIKNTKKSHQHFLRQRSLSEEEKTFSRRAGESHEHFPYAHSTPSYFTHIAVYTTSHITVHNVFYIHDFTSFTLHT